MDRSLTATVDCCGERHRIVWEGGRLSFPDHDLGAEDVVGSLGGHPPTCPAVRSAAAALAASDFSDSNGRELLMDYRSPSQSAMEKGMDALFASGRLGPLVKKVELTLEPQDPLRVASVGVLAQLELRRAIASIPEPMRTAVRIQAAQKHFRRQVSTADLLLKDQVGAAFTAAAPGPLTVDCFLIDAAEFPGVSGWTDGRTGISVLYVRRDWTRCVTDGCTVVDGFFVLKAQCVSKEPGPAHAMAVRWEPVDGEWSAVAAPAALDRTGSDWHLTWID
ncbi:MAG TPA: hypothetical protein VNE62_11685 [Actinomycetota bacterium]|nr:hypothetical protein [Actinomycetota bacterium]